MPEKLLSVSEKADQLFSNSLAHLSARRLLVQYLLDRLDLEERHNIISDKYSVSLPILYFCDWDVVLCYLRLEDSVTAGAFESLLNNAARSNGKIVVAMQSGCHSEMLSFIGSELSPARNRIFNKISNHKAGKKDVIDYLTQAEFRVSLQLVKRLVFLLRHSAFKFFEEVKDSNFTKILNQEIRQKRPQDNPRLSGYLEKWRNSPKYRVNRNVDSDKIDISNVTEVAQLVNLGISAVLISNTRNLRSTFEKQVVSPLQALLSSDYELKRSNLHNRKITLYRSQISNLKWESDILSKRSAVANRIESVSSGDLLYSFKQLASESRDDPTFTAFSERLRRIDSTARIKNQEEYSQSENVELDYQKFVYYEQTAMGLLADYINKNNLIDLGIKYLYGIDGNVSKVTTINVHTNKAYASLKKTDQLECYGWISILSVSALCKIVRESLEAVTSSSDSDIVESFAVDSSNCIKGLGSLDDENIDDVDPYYKILCFKTSVAEVYIYPPESRLDEKPRVWVKANNICNSDVFIELMEKSIIHPTPLSTIVGILHQ